MQLLEDLLNIWVDQGKAFQVETCGSISRSKTIKADQIKHCRYPNGKPTLKYEDTVNFAGEWYVEYYKNNKENIAKFTVSQITKLSKYCL